MKINPNQKRKENKGPYVSEIREKDRVEGVFLVSKKEVAISRNGKPYLVLKLRDRTGEAEARIWDSVEEVEKVFSKNDFVIIKGWAVSYQGGIQINITSIKRHPEKDVTLSDFLPSSEREPEEMMDDLKGIIKGMRNIYLRRLLTLFVEDKAINRLWKDAPAAKSMHHAYLGGLLEHSISISRLAMDVARHYKGINTDLLLTGAILHDIGKIYELSYNRVFDYTDEGRLLGHISIGIEMIDKKIDLIPDFPKHLKMLVKHMVLSHHGHLEYGSPKRPKTVEAVMLYYLDDMDSKVQSIQNLIKKEEGIESKWTSYHRLYDRYIYKGDTHQNEGEEEPLDKTKGETSPTYEVVEELELFPQKGKV